MTDLFFYKDGAWKLIAKAVVSNEFGKNISAKVSTPSTNDLMGEGDVHTVSSFLIFFRYI